MAEDVTQQGTLLIVQYASLLEVTGTSPDGGERNAFERRVRDLQR